jgi:hypothetical protein
MLKLIPAVVMAAFLAAFPGKAQEPYSKLRNAGPTTLAIIFRCDPAKKADLREHMLKAGLARFEGYKARGVLKDYRILFNSYLDTEAFDMLSLLTFEKYADVARWREIEKTAPGGLSEEGLKLISSAVTSSLDVVRHAAPSQEPVRGKSVFFIIPYDYEVATDEYVKYLDGYVIPQVTGWIKEDVLAAYTIYLSRYSTSRPWSSLFVLEYRDGDAFGLREATVTKVRAALQNNPEWKALSDTKHKIRIEKQTVIAEELIHR